MKVAVLTPGGPLRLERSLFVNDRTTGKPVKKIPASVDHRILTTDELILYGIGHKESDTTSGRPTSEQTARGAYRVVGVSRGHIRPG